MVAQVAHICSILSHVMRPIGHASQRPEVVKEETVEEATNAVLAGPPRDTWGRNSKPEKRKKKLEKKGENPERKSCAECASEFVKSWRIQLSKHVCGEGVWKICSSWGYLFSDDLILVLAVLLSDGHYTLSHDEMTHTWIRYPLVGQISFFMCVQCIPTLFDESNQCQISVKSPYFTILEHIPDCCLLPHVCGSKSYVLRVRWWMAEAYFPRYRAYLRGQVNPTCLKPPACFRDV